MPRVYSYPARHAGDTLILSWRCSPQSDSFISHQILGMAGIGRHSQTKGRATGSPAWSHPAVGADISVSEVPTDAVPGVGSGHGTLERSRNKRLRIAASERRRRSGPKGRSEGEGPVLCGSVECRGTGEYMAEVRTSSQSERPCADIEETRNATGDAGGGEQSRRRKVHSLIDKIYAPANLAEAWKRVRENKGSAGIDGLTITAFENRQAEHLAGLHARL